MPSIPRAATPHAWRGRRWCASRAPPNDADQTRGAHGPTVANGVGDAGAIDCCLGPHLRPRLHAALLPGSARAHLASASRPAARRPFTPAAAPLTLLPRNRPQAIASMRARRLRRNSRARAPRAGPIGARRALAAVPRDPVRSPPRGCHAAGRPRRIGRRIGQLFRRERLGHCVGVVSAGMAHWLRGPKVRALGGVAGRTCAAVRGASVLASSQLPCRVVYFCCSPARRPLEMSPCS